MTGAIPECPPPESVRRLLACADVIASARDRLLVARDATASSPVRSGVLAELVGALAAEIHALDEILAVTYRLVELAEDTWDDVDGPAPLPDTERAPARERLHRATGNALTDLRRLSGAHAPEDPAHDTLDTRSEVVAWGGLDAEAVYARIRDVPHASRRLLAYSSPVVVGNTHGVPWALRAFANALAVRGVLHREQRAGTAWSPRIGRLETMLRRTPDPADQAGRPVRRTFIAFSPERTGRMSELVGRIDTRTCAVGVYVPGTGTNLDMSHVNTDVAVHFVRTAGPGLAVVAFLDGEFPQDLMTESGQMRYAEHMAPRLVRFCREIDRVVELECPGAAVTVLGHSYGGRIVGTAERVGLRADRVVYVESPDRGVGVRPGRGGREPRTVPAGVARFSFTAPGDPIELMQVRFGLRRRSSHADLGPDIVRLDTGRYADGTPIYGPRGHGGVFAAGSDPVRGILAVMLGGQVDRWRDRGIRARHTRAAPGSDGRVLPALWRLAVGQWLRRHDDPYGDPRIVWEGPRHTVTVPTARRLIDAPQPE